MTQEQRKIDEFKVNIANAILTFEEVERILVLTEIKNSVMHGRQTDKNQLLRIKELLSIIRKNLSILTSNDEEIKSILNKLNISVKKVDGITEIIFSNLHKFEFGFSLPFQKQLWVMNGEIFSGEEPLDFKIKNYLILIIIYFKHNLKTMLEDIKNISI